MEGIIKKIGYDEIVIKPLIAFGQEIDLKVGEKITITRGPPHGD